MKNLPLVSVLTPTFNRRFFIPQYIKYVKEQNYRGKIEVIIANDGEQDISDLIPNHGYFKLITLQKKQSIGFKRNLLMHEAKGDIIVHMDDDDYYPPQRITHAVENLLKSDATIAGTSLLNIYDTSTDLIYKSGPFLKYHATANTMAYKKEYIKTHSYDETCLYGEESSFTKKFSEKLLQLNPEDTILAIKHSYNTFDKKKTTKKITNHLLRNFIKDSNHIKFYKNIHSDYLNMLINNVQINIRQKQEAQNLLRLIAHSNKKIEEIISAIELIETSKSISLNSLKKIVIAR